MGAAPPGISVSDIEARRGEDKGLTWSQNRYLEILRRGDRDICFYCHIDMTDLNRTLDHVIPKAKGGTNDLWNLCLSCNNCNRLKADQSAHEFLVALRRRRAPFDKAVPQSLPIPPVGPLVPKFPPPSVKKKCPKTCQCACHEPLGGNPHPGAPCPGKLPQPVVPWDHGHDEARERISAVKRSLEDQTAIEAGWKEES